MGFLKKPIGPLPLWAWLGLGLFAAIGYYIWSQKKAASSASSQSSDTSTGTGTTDSSLIPQFVNQVYTNNTPPEAPPTTASSGTGTTSTGTGGNSSTTLTTLAVPNVAGLTADQAEVKLKNAGFNPSITLTSASNKPGIFHIITKTSPAAGSNASKGSTVTLYYKDSKNS
jgi:hypothetical protein